MPKYRFSIDFSLTSNLLIEAETLDDAYDALDWMTEENIRAALVNPVPIETQFAGSTFISEETK